MLSHRLASSLAAVLLTLSTIGCSAPPTRSARWSDSVALVSSSVARGSFDPTSHPVIGGSDAPLPQSAAKPATCAEGFALGVYGVRHALGGDFDGSTAIVGPLDLIVLPDYDAGVGFGAALGLNSPGGSFDMHLEATEHKFGYRWTRFSSADGVAGSGTLDDSVSAGGLFLALGAVFTF